MILVGIVDLFDVLGHLWRSVQCLLDHRVRVVVEDSFTCLRRRTTNQGRASDVAHNTRRLHHDLAMTLFGLTGAGSGGVDVLLERVVTLIAQVEECARLSGLAAQGVLLEGTCRCRCCHGMLR